jgi:hypothetical protein
MSSKKRSSGGRKHTSGGRVTPKGTTPPGVTPSHASGDAGTPKDESKPTFSHEDHRGRGFTNAPPPKRAGRRGNR